MKNYKKLTKKVIGIVLAAAMIVTSIPNKRQEAEAAGDSTVVEVNVTYGQTEARSMLSDLNAWRTSNTWLWNSDNVTKTSVTGRTALQYDARLERIAMRRAAEIALSFSHTRPSGEDTWSAYGDISEYGYVGENIAAGQRTASAALTSWKEEDEDYSGQGHRRNMLNENFNYIGIAHVVVNGTHYWVQEFSKYTNGEVLGTACDSDMNASVNINNNYIAAAGVTVEQDNVELNLSDKTTCGLPKAKASIVVANAWPSRYTDIESPAPTWTVSSGNAVVIEGQNIKAVSSGSATLTAAVELAGKTYSADCTVVVTASALSGNPTEEPGLKPTSTPVTQTGTEPSPTPATQIGTEPSSTPGNSAATPSSIVVNTSSPTNKPTATNKPKATTNPQTTKTVTTAKPRVTMRPVATRIPSTITVGKTTIKQVTAVKLKNKKGRKISISWKKIADAGKYQVQCSMNEKFSRLVCNIYIKKCKHVVKYLKKKKTYYVRIRAIKKNSSELGKWSYIKKIKVKK